VLFVGTVAFGMVGLLGIRTAHITAEQVYTPILMEGFRMDGFSAGASFGDGMTTEGTGSRSDSGWTFFARHTNGFDTIFQDLSQDELDTFSVESGIESGEMTITLRQGNIIKSADLSENAPFDIDMSVFEPGTIAIQFDFSEASNVFFNVSWR